LGGFNSDRFDIPLLAEELLRAGVDFEMKNCVSVDVQTIFHKRANSKCCPKFIADKV
jgi:DNA polymerase-3 subunit epsilon